MRLDGIVKRRKDSDDANDFRLDELTNRLEKYSADAVQHALQVVTWEWFPAWSELEAVLEKFNGHRRVAVSNLRKLASAPVEKALPAEPLTDADRAEMQANLAHFTTPSKQSTADPHAGMTDEDFQAAIRSKYAGRGPSPQLLALIERETA